jgi:hypothetical protein
MPQILNICPVDDLTIDQLLAIPLNEPELLFQPDAAAIKSRYRALAKKFYPDKCKDPRANDAFDHAKQLSDAAERKLEEGTWETPGLLQLKQMSGRMSSIRYLKKHPFELGDMYICDGKLVFVVKEEFEDLFKNAQKNVKAFEFANDKMRNGISYQLPEYEGSFPTSDGRQVMVLKRDNDLILMRDLIDHAGGKIEPVHTAWILSRLHNLSCYLQSVGIAHNDISPDTVFVRPKDHVNAPEPGSEIAPKDHTIALLGGWWYAVKEGMGYVGLPERTLNSIPHKDLNSRNPQATTRTNQALIRLVGRELLGDTTGVRLARDSKAPKPLIDWITLPGCGDAFQDDKTWREEILPQSFGKRRFVAWDVQPNLIYSPHP